MFEIVLDEAKHYALSLFGRRYKKNKPKYGVGHVHSREQENARRRRQIAAGSLKTENGLLQ